MRIIICYLFIAFSFLFLTENLLAQPCLPPDSASISIDSAQHIILSWNAVSNAQGYTVEFSDTGGVFNTILSQDTFVFLSPTDLAVPDLIISIRSNCGGMTSMPLDIVIAAVEEVYIRCKDGDDFGGSKYICLEDFDYECFEVSCICNFVSDVCRIYDLWCGGDYPWVNPAPYVYIKAKEFKGKYIIKPKKAKTADKAKQYFLAHFIEGTLILDEYCKEGEKTPEVQGISIQSIRLRRPGP